VRVPGAKLARRVASRWRARLLGGGVILGYHRVADESFDPWSLTVHPEHFRRHMGLLRRTFEPVPLNAVEMASSSGSGRSRKGFPVAVTFDDGYRDVVENALPVLEEFEIPATLFIVTDGLGGTFWWDRLGVLLQRSVRSNTEVRFEAGGRSFAWDPDAAEEVLMAGAHRTLQEAGCQEREQVLAQLESREADAGGHPGTVPRVVDEEDLRELARHPLLEIGSHTVTHPRLSALAPSEVDHELEQSRSRLERLTERPVTSLSYPHGARDPGLSVRVEAAGYARACMSRNGLLGGQTDRFALPRLWPADLSEPEFARWLRSWTGR
jgi:peptidoglycan/xylan/chitin deacetylase (PgdA/CDA1 family)